MMKVLIMYHPDFASMGKFERKLSRIFSQSNNYQVFYFHDHNNLINQYFSIDLLTQLTPDVLTDLLSVGVTHAVLFDSSTQPQFLSHYKVLSEKIPVRYIKDNITFTSNKDRGEHFDIYCGRGTLWGNPYAIGVDGDREEVIRKFKYDFDRDYLKGGAEFKEKLKALRGQTLGCHCKPYACHCDVLSQYLNELDDGE
ncbi:DUF4326 domain-containing protein [Enterobacter hormaechei]|uniref:DUF4326 domain-containing protein n=1 Tax=Enterobacter hormaechei TaxID=158836 RepID=UPI0007937F08|nr:DUF4326 domain-containing protein [Enterobacter hormaechei]CAF3154329.1 hypothetical protein AI2983V1_3649 [Enterobacter cloacae]MCE1523039.1 DUF4326 domain-containing protein [Enterobacter hormaechei]MDV5283636.1 DUF4326 domain-containing protein [Enterobacter hormaechei]MDV5315996.1 DUF4326 domain-containing protein [Enterobacter hormaechei]MDV5382278.1 DUF4326 domain-containing protein [Enterobacter hormaechei]